MDGISNHWILKNPNSIMKTYWFKLDQPEKNTKLLAEMLSSLDSESEDEKSLASLIKTVDLANDTTSVTITRTRN
ncbi:hypothetical protein Gotur_031871, partial [Gossypium turneri]